MNESLTTTWVELAGYRAVEAQPRAGDGDWPLLVALHGRGDCAQDFARIAPWLVPYGYRLLVPDGYFAWGGGRAWYDHSPPRESEIAASRAMLLAFVTAAQERYRTPPERTALVGFSQGGLMALDVGLRFPARLAGLVSMSGYLFAPEAVPAALGAAGRPAEPPILLIHGLDDTIVAPQRSRRAHEALRAAGLQVEHHEFPMDHTVTPESLAVVRAFLARVLAGAQP
jgi:phospholipase/carboxylesterase